MRILILEDDVNRHKYFTENLYGADLKIVSTAKNCIYELQNNGKWDVLFLDHDLGNQVIVSSEKNTGYEVATWLEEHPNFKPESIIIHSMNYIGAARMKITLPEAIVAPGAWISVKYDDIKES